MQSTIWLACHVGLLVGLIRVPLIWNVSSITIISSLIVVRVLITSMILHRYFAHASYQCRSAIIHIIITIIACIAGHGSPLTWANQHRVNHQYHHRHKGIPARDRWLASFLTANHTYHHYHDV
jgi:fatty-acid desaturase